MTTTSTTSTAPATFIKFDAYADRCVEIADADGSLDPTADYMRVDIVGRTLRATFEIIDGDDDGHEWTAYQDAYGVVVTAEWDDTVRGGGDLRLTLNDGTTILVDSLYDAIAAEVTQ